MPNSWPQDYPCSAAPVGRQCGSSLMFVGCWQVIWAHWQIIWVRGPGYWQLMWAESGNVCGSDCGCLRAVTVTEWFLEYPTTYATGRTHAVTPSQRKNARTEEPKQNPKKEPAEPTSSAPEAIKAPTQELAPDRKDPLKEDSVGQSEEVRGTSASPPDTVLSQAREIIPGKTNRPLPFSLKSIDVDHPECDRLGFERETLTHFRVGYFTGKGMMHGKVVFPFHNKEGLLVAYIGYSLKDGSFTYPEAFDQRIELYNYPQCEYGLDAERDSVVLVTDLLNVLRLYDFGVRNVVALPTEEIYEPQLDLIESLVGLGGQVDFVPWT